ncbi:MAG: Uma2 family endonuclease [Deltaproteobacteria bacterium]|nr:Uma2 family endonuclease [Deltaproteobacteria bacterium]
MVSVRPLPRVPYTYEAYRLIPHDGRRWELIDGDLYVNPAPTPWHQVVSRRLQHTLMDQLEEPGIAWVFDAPVDVILDPTNTVEPDLVLVRCTRRESITGRGIEAPPDVVVEILSPSNRAHDQVLKRLTYARFNIPEYWVVDPEVGSVEVLRLVDGQYQQGARFDRAGVLQSAEFPQVRVPLPAVFKPL